LAVPFKPRMERPLEVKQVLQYKRVPYTNLTLPTLHNCELQPIVYRINDNSNESAQSLAVCTIPEELTIGSLVQSVSDRGRWFDP